jgi:hypothetical protein
MVDDRGSVYFGEMFHASKGNHRSLMFDDRDSVDLARCSIVEDKLLIID